MLEPLKIFIGYDKRETDAAVVCAKSLRQHASVPLSITFLIQDDLRRAGLYRRTTKDGKRVDSRDGRPFSTDFAFTRFLVPTLSLYAGWSLFVDCDFLFRADVAELFGLADERYPLMCVHHDHRPAEKQKMDGQKQEPYERKNWSSLVLWNNGHTAHENLTVDDINLRPGSWLHRFGWVHSTWQIGRLPEEWNYLVGHSDRSIRPKAVHFTSGGPWMRGYEDVEYADEWRAAAGMELRHVA